MNKSLVGKKIGFVGLGNMGRLMAVHLLQAGADVIVWNRSPAAIEAAVQLGMRRAENLPALASEIADGIVCINLTTSDVVEAIVFGADGLIQGLHNNAIIVDFGTTGFNATRRFAERIDWIDAPVSGGQVGAEAASLAIMVGGRAESFERVRPLLDVLGKNVKHLGPAGSGQVTKLANQLIVAQTIDAVAQALRLAELAGLDAGQVRQALLGGFADSRILELHGDRMVRRDFAPGGRAKWQLKDVRLICELAEAVGLRSTTLDNCRAQWERFVNEEGGADLDHSGLFRTYENG